MTDRCLALALIRRVVPAYFWDDHSDRCPDGDAGTATEIKRSGTESTRECHVMRAAILAREFSRVLRSWLSPAEMACAIVGNRAETSPLVCHSHDYCDANMAMDEAFTTVVGRNVIMPSDVEENGASDAQHVADFTLWNEAWNIAKAAEFDAGPLFRFSWPGMQHEPAPIIAGLTFAAMIFTNHDAATVADLAALPVGGSSLDDFDADCLIERLA